MKRMLVLAAAVAVVTSVACAAPTRNTRPAVVIVSDDDEAFDMALRAVVAAGLSVQMKDRGAGLIQTEWQDATSVAVRVIGEGSVGKRFRFVISISDGRATVTPVVEVCGSLGCNAIENMTEIEAAKLTAIVRALH